jgi:hypothetical protein
MTVALAFLQNMWVKDPARVQAIIAENGEEYRRKLTRRLLFAGGLTGRRIRAAFGDELLQHVEFEEASPEIAGDSRRICQPDPDHIRAQLTYHRPQLVITFGRVASDAVAPIWTGPTLKAPHPAARLPFVVDALKFVARQASVIMGLEHEQVPPGAAIVRGDR